MNSFWPDRVRIRRRGACAVVAAALVSFGHSIRVQEVVAAESAKPKLIYPNGLAFDANGRLFISDIGSHCIYRLENNGALVLVAGTGEAGFAGDGGPATQARLAAPHDLTFDSEGNLLVADTYNHRIRRIDRRGIITTVVGNGKEGWSGDGGPAVRASLNNPQSIALDAGGNLYIADTYNYVVRRVDRQGTIATFAGSEPGLAGDGGPATKAQLSLPMAVAVAPDGSVYISDAGNSRIRRVTPDGVIKTIAGFGPGSGTGGAGFSGDGGAPERAKIFSAADIKFDPAGALFISDSGNNRIRVIREGVIGTVAGSGRPGFDGDTGDALKAALNTPQKLAIGPDGSVFVADRANRRVRKVDAAGLIQTVAGEGEPAEAIIDPAVETRRARAKAKPELKS